MRRPNKIAAVIVLYEMPLYETATYRTLLSQNTLPFLVYDNSKLAQKLELSPTSSYLHNPQNVGVSGAYNYAIRWARGIGASHLLLLDSDSEFPSQSLAVYEKAIEEHSDKIILPTLISAGRKISPFYFYNGKTHYGEAITEGEITLGKVVAVNSASLLPLECISESDNFHEELPLDWSDIYFYRKMAKSKIKAFHIPLEINHSLSDHEERPLNAAQYRFGLLHQGAVYIHNSLWEAVQIHFWIFMKSIKLCLKYKSPRFILISLGLKK